MRKIAVWIAIAACVELLSRVVTRSPYVLHTTPTYSDVSERIQWSLDEGRGDGTVNTASSHQYDPMLGWIPKAGFRGKSGPLANVVINSQSMRNDSDYALQKTPGTTRIVILGDSFTFGSGVAGDQTYVSVLGRSLPATEVLNMGVEGYGLDQMLIRLNRDAFRYSPDIVIIAFIGDDLSRSLLRFRDYAKPKFALRGDTLILDNTPVPDPATLARRMRFIPATFDLITLLYDRIRFHTPPNSEVARMSNAIWRQMAETVRQHGAVPLFVFLPSGRQMTVTGSAYFFEESLMNSFCDRYKANCLTARRYMRPAGITDKDASSGSHYNANIHEMVGVGLAGDLVRRFPEKFLTFQQASVSANLW